MSEAEAAKVDEEAKPAPEVEKDDAVEKPEVSDVEAKALKMGWTPKEEFKGDPAKWRPADEFVERGENMLPIVKAKVKQQERVIAELQRSMQELGEYHTKTEQRAYASALATLKQQRADAIASADGVAFDKVDTEIDRLNQEMASKKPIVKPNIDPATDPVYVEWESRNKWVKDPELEKMAYKIGEALHEAGVTETGTEFLDMVGKKMRLAFPERFTNPRRENAPAVESGVPAARKGGKSFADLPAEARAACERMAKNAYSTDEKQRDKFKAEYTKNYFSEEA